MVRVQGGCAAEPAGPAAGQPDQSVWWWDPDSGGLLCPDKQ